MAMPAYACTQQLSLSLSNEHYGLIHGNQIGTVVIWLNKSSWRKIEPSENPDVVSQFLKDLQAKSDTYISVNEFHGWRRTGLLKSLRACYVDLDFKLPVTENDVSDALEVLNTKRMPKPSFMTFTGRGLHFYWLLEPTPASALPVWQVVENALVNSLKDFHADPHAKDCARQLRLVGTVNSKTSAVVVGQVFDNKPWTLHQLADEVLGPREIKTKEQINGLNKTKIKSFEKAQVIKGIHPKAVTHRRWHLVLLDLYIIAGHYKRIPEGHRNNFLFIASVALSWFASLESIQDEIIDMMKQYCPDLSESDAMLACKNSIKRAQMAKEGKTIIWNGDAVDARYRYKRQSLYNLLEPLAKPILYKLKAIIPNSLATERKKQNDAKRYGNRYTKQGHSLDNAAKFAKARLMSASGIKQVDIAEALDVRQGTVSKWLK